MKRYYPLLFMSFILGALMAPPDIVSQLVNGATCSLFYALFLGLSQTYLLSDRGKGYKSLICILCLLLSLLLTYWAMYNIFAGTDPG